MEGKGNVSNNISIVKRRGFDSSTPLIVKSSSTTAECFAIPFDISNSSALLDSLIMLPNAQAPSSPTTGTLRIPTAVSTHDECFLDNYKWENGVDGGCITIALDQASSKYDGEAHYQEFHRVTGANKLPFDELKYPRDWQEIMTGKGCSKDHGTLAAETTPVVSSRQAVTPTKCTNMKVISSTRNQLPHTDQIGKKRNTQLPNESDKMKHKKLGEVAKYSEDGFYWRKYGQKHVKGSEYPRSYYKCTNANCPVRKKVERFHNGIIAEIEYKGFHNHPKPQPFKRPFAGEVLSASKTNVDDGESCSKTKDIVVIGGSSDCRSGATDRMVIPSTSFVNEFSNPLSASKNTYECMEGQEYPSATFGCQEGDTHQNEASSESISFNDEDGDNCESEPLKRKRECFLNDQTILPRSTREPKVVLQIESDIDILEDGYRWRKYGQKVVKGNPNPRSYYKCTTPGCLVRKHVERAANDIKSVITTYEGKHNHEVPSSKNSSSLPTVSEAGHSLSSVVDNNGTITIPMASSKPVEHVTSNAGKQFQDIASLYLDRKPIFNNYHDFVRRSNMQPTGNFPNDLINFGSPCPSVYSLPFPPPIHPTLPNYGSLLMNGINQIIKSCPSSNDEMYPSLPECMSLQPSQINQLPTSSAAASNSMPLQAAVGNFHNHFSSYVAPRPNLPPGNMKLENTMPEL